MRLWIFIAAVLVILLWATVEGYSAGPEEFIHLIDVKA